MCQWLLGYLGRRTAPGSRTEGWLGQSTAYHLQRTGLRNGFESTQLPRVSIFETNGLRSPDGPAPPRVPGKDPRSAMGWLHREPAPSRPSTSHTTPDRRIAGPRSKVRASHELQLASLTGPGHHVGSTPSWCSYASSHREPGRGVVCFTTAGPESRGPAGDPDDGQRRLEADREKQ